MIPCLKREVIKGLDIARDNILANCETLKERQAAAAILKAIKLLQPKKKRGAK